MVGADAAADAVARARRLPKLRVGLHLVLVDGRPTLPDIEIPGLVRGVREFDRNMARAGVRFFFLPQVRRQLAIEIRAQFAAFRATGLPLDHVNAHKHLQLHPALADLIIEIGCDYGMKAMRLPAEPVAVLRRAFPNELHPAAEPTPLLAAAMPCYRHPEELAALLSPAVRRQITECGIRLVSYCDLTAAAD